MSAMETRPCALTDPRMPGLARALDPDSMTPWLAPLCARAVGGAQGAAGSWRVTAVDVLKLKAGRRCALAYALEGPAGRFRFFAKMFASDRGATIFVTMTRLAAAVSARELKVPRPVAYLPDLKLLVTEYLDGASLAGPLYEGASDEPAVRMAAAIHALHCSEVPSTRTWSPQRECRSTAAWVDRLRPRGDELHGHASAHLEALGRWASRLPQVSDRPVHRDFYPDQVWDCNGKTALLDLDDSRVGDPAVDLGNFLAHLSLRAIQFPTLRAGCERARGVFPAAYASRLRQNGSTQEVPALLWERVRFYEAASLLRLAGVYSARDRWAGTLPQVLLGACGAALNTGG